MTRRGRGHEPERWTTGAAMEVAACGEIGMIQPKASETKGGIREEGAPRRTLPPELSLPLRPNPSKSSVLGIG